MKETSEKRKLHLEAARLAKTHRLGGGIWTDEDAAAAESIANRMLGHTSGGRRNRDLRSGPPGHREIPSGDCTDLGALSPIVYMVP